MALDSLDFKIRLGLNWTATVNITGLSNPNTNNNNPTKQISIGTAANNNAVGGGDSLYATLLSIGASGSATIDLQAFSDVLGQSAQSLARIKFFYAHLLSDTLDAEPFKSLGTACSGVTIGNSGVNGHQLWLGADAETFTLAGGDAAFFGSPQAAGKTVDASNKDVLVTNDDGAVTAKVLVVFGGGTT